MRVTWIVLVAGLWPVLSIGAWHVAHVAGPVAGFGAGVLVAAPGLLAVAAAEESRRWRRVTGAAVAITTLVAVVIYGSFVIDIMNCRDAIPAEVAPTMLVVGVPAGISAGLLAWQGGRLVAARRWVGIAIAFVVGWALLALVIGALVFRSLMHGCFGY